MLWIVTIEDIKIPVRAASEQALLAQLEEILELPLEAVDYALQALPDVAEILAGSQIVLQNFEVTDQKHSRYPTSPFDANRINTAG